MSKGTRPTQVRLTQADKVNLEAVRVKYGCLTASDAIRTALAVASGRKPRKKKEPPCHDGRDC